MPVVEDSVAVRAVPEPDRLPTLTEVVQLASDPWAAAAWAAEPLELPAAPEPASLLAEVIGAPVDWGSVPPAAPAEAVQAPAWDEDQIICQVLTSLEQRLDGLFEARLREALAPALARAADGLIRDLRPELTQALHDLVHDAVARALQEMPRR